MTADQIRRAMGAELAAVADQLRSDFGAKLTWLKSEDLEVGRDPSIGSVRANGKLDEETRQMKYWYGRRA